MMCAGWSVTVGGCSKGSEDPDAPEPLRVDTTLGGIGDTPGKFAYPRAIESDPFSGNLWVIDRSGRVQEIDPETGRCVTYFKMPKTELGYPVGLTIGPGKNSEGKWTERLLYIPDTHNNRVMVVEPPAIRPKASIKREDPPEIVEPKIVRMVGKYGEGPGEFIYPTDVAILLNDGRDGRAAGSEIERIYVSEYGGHDRVSVFDGDFNFIASFGAFGSSDGGVAKDIVEFNRPQEIRIDRDAKAKSGEDRRLVIMDSRNHRLGMFTLDGKLIRWIGSPDTPGEGRGQFRFPWGLLPLGDGTAMVTEFQNCRVQRVDLETGESLGVWGKPGMGDGEMNNPWSLARLKDELYVVDARNNRVLGFGIPRKRSW